MHPMSKQMFHALSRQQVFVLGAKTTVYGPHQGLSAEHTTTKSSARSFLVFCALLAAAEAGSAAAAAACAILFLVANETGAVALGPLAVALSSRGGAFAFMLAFLSLALLMVCMSASGRITWQ